MKKYKNGLVLGKFAPVTMGHKHLVDTALSKCESLTVLVCSLENEPIPGDLRYEWMKEMFPTAKVIHVTDNNPLRISDLSPIFKNSTDDFFWSRWIETICHHMDNVDVVFTSEQYGAELAQKLTDSGKNFNVSYEVVDIKRETVPISGTLVRNDPFKYWDFIPEVVRPYFAKKVAIVGPESTGKSTMAKMLAEHYKTTYVAEYGREYTEKFYMGLDTKEFTIEDISKIAAGHLFREELELKKCNKIFFSDTETITTEIWSEIYFGKSPQWLKEINKHNPFKYDLYLLLDIDVPWINDGTRHMSDQEKRKKHFERIRDELITKKVPFAIINGNYEERLKKAIYGINHFVFHHSE